MINYSVSVAMMRFTGQLGRIGQLDALGISRKDYERFVGDNPWLLSDRGRMSTVLHQLLTGVLDAQGIPRINVPAEYLAAVIAVFVAPINVMAACSWAPATGEADQMTKGGKFPRVSPDDLFAIVARLYEDNSRSDAKVRFETSVGIEVKKSVDGVPSGMR